MEKPILSLLFFSVSALAGKATFQGEGRILNEADHVELTVTVVSECYDTAKESTQANDKIALQVMETLKGYTNQEVEEDGVFSNGGYTERYSGFDNTRRLPVCVNTFRKTNRVLLRSSNIKDFAKDFSEIQDELYGLKMDHPGGVVDQPLSSLTISQPQAGLKYERYHDLQIKSLAMAIEDAKRKFEATMQPANVRSYQIVAYHDGGSIVPYPRPDRGLPKYSSPEARTEAPVEFDKLTIMTHLSVEFEF